MTDQDESGATDETEQTEPEVQVTEQKTEPSYADTLLALAREEGGSAEVVSTEDKPEPETLEDEVPATEPESKDEPEQVEAKEEEKSEAKKGDEWPSSAKERVAEETAKRKRANERAEKAEEQVAQLQAQFAQATAPKPTEDDPFRDVNDPNALDRLEASYEKAIELADENPEGAENVLIGKRPDGTEIREDFTPEKLAEVKRKAEKAIRKFIPERRSYLQQRAVADQQAAQIYPELQDPDSDFTKAVATLAHSLFSGQAMKAPDILQWIGHAVKGYQMKIQENGHGKEAKVKSPEAKKIVHAAATKIAPTPTRSRSFVERGTRSVNMDKAAKKFEQKGDDESAEELVGAIFANRGGSKRLEPTGE